MRLSPWWLTARLLHHSAIIATFTMLTLTIPPHCEAYWLMSASESSSAHISTHAHAGEELEDPRFAISLSSVVLGGSNFGMNVSTASLRNSACTSIPIPQDKSNYCYLNRWANGSFTSVTGNAVMYVAVASYRNYLFNNTPGYTTEFPDDVSDPTLRTLDPSSFAQQAITFLCLDFNGKSNRYNELPRGISCPSGIRSQINFPSCWNGKDVDSSDHKSHVAFLNTGPDNGTCTDPAFPVTLPRIFMEVYWISQDFEDQRKQALTPNPTGYGYHADFFNGWAAGVLQRALDGCNCNPYGDATCCVNQGIFGMNTSSACFITDTFDEQTLGTLETLPGNNPIQAPCYETYVDPIIPAILAPVYVYNGSAGGPTGTAVTPAETAVVQQTANGSCIWKGAAISSRKPNFWPGLWLSILVAASVLW
ncbi:hypothetical protein R3P38DRAFT_2847000 [Favolaschia claudopus]|uniref:DUF1996 domain-containing protein n=1 Tax=Favolaschia claudopus TaxID=2862362 RepID=A0AAW0DWY6_9AGAR